MTNALKIVGKKIEDIKVVVTVQAQLLQPSQSFFISRGLKNVILCDRKGAIYNGREGLNSAKQEMAEITNPNKEAGSPR